ncbi:MAG: hypothetical protein LBT22_07865, partial [Peptococcaceae bacterium]|nr:hypothetical protein [Peptococcaceae bacterium]
APEQTQAKGGRFREKRGMDAERVPLRQEGAAGRKAEPSALWRPQKKMRQKRNPPCGDPRKR